MSIKKTNQKGFTLIELLVVIAIIGVLSTLSVVALNNARQKARDAKRVADVKQVQTALELYYNDVGLYPPNGAADPGDSIENVTSSITYMVTVPDNPEPWTDGECSGTDAANYTYTSDNSGASYTITYCIAAPTGGLLAGGHNATPAGIMND